MSMKDTMIGAAARGGFTVIRFMVLHLPDRAMAFLARAAVKLGYIVTGDEAMMNAGAEIVDIFESGPPFTPTIRKLMRAAEPEVVVSAVKCQARPSPYGAKP